ncbi:hypothetical protein ACI8AF_21910 [Blastococcus sp. SYSU D00669]
MKMLLGASSLVVCALAVVGGAVFLETTPALGFALVGAGVLFGVLGALLVHLGSPRSAARPRAVDEQSAGYEAANALGAALDALR